VRTPLLGTIVLSLVACSTAPVLPPEDDRVFEIVETDLWSGGELQAVVRYAEAKELPPTIVLGGDTLDVTRVDDTTFAAPLPVQTGQLAVRVEGTELPPLERMVTLHGFVSGTIGPAVGGAIVTRPVAGGHVVLGSTFEGAAEVSLESAQVIRTWPLSVQSVRCSGGIAPGPIPGHIIVRSGNGVIGGSCEYHRSRPYDANGIGPSTDDAFGAGAYHLSAILGPGMVLRATNQWGFVDQCTTATVPWSGCQNVANMEYGSLVGYAAGYVAKRIIPLARRTAIHDLETGAVVAKLPDTPTTMFYTAAAFSASEDSVYLGTHGGLGPYVGLPGLLLVLDARTGAILDEMQEPDGVPVALAVDDARNLVLAVIKNRNAEQLWLQVRSRTDHSVVAELPVNDAPLVEAAKFHNHYQLVLNRVQNQAVLVTTEGMPPFQTTPILPMVIARWTLPPE
jgi:hypothetical protein